MWARTHTHIYVMQFRVRTIEITYLLVQFHVLRICLRTITSSRARCAQWIKFAIHVAYVSFHYFDVSHVANFSRSFVSSCVSCHSFRTINRCGRVSALIVPKAIARGACASIDSADFESKDKNNILHCSMRRMKCEAHFMYEAYLVCSLKCSWRIWSSSAIEDRQSYTQICDTLHNDSW